MTVHTSQRKKILLVTRPLSPPWDEASKNFAFNLARNLTDHDITILVDTLIDDLPEHITQKKIYSKNHLSFSQKIRLVLYLLAHGCDYDIIHLLFTPTRINSAIMRWILPKKNVVQTIATVRDDLYDHATLAKMFFGNTRVTYSLWAHDKLTQMGFRDVVQIYPGIDLSKFSPKPKDTRLMERWGYSAHDIIVTYPGEFTRLGATDLIIDAFERIWRDPATAHIKYLCNCRIKNDADQQKKQEIIARLETNGYRDRVVFTDTFADMNAIYNLSDIIIFPVTTMRGKFDVPLAMIEPYACKKPVIASDLDLFKEFSHPDINVIIPPADCDALASAIIDLSRDANRRHTLGENAFAFAHRTFNISHIAKKYDTLYRHIQG